jgi:hypothetical protein
LWSRAHTAADANTRNAAVEGAKRRNHFARTGSMFGSSASPERVFRTESLDNLTPTPLIASSWTGRRFQAPNTTEGSVADSSRPGDHSAACDYATDGLLPYCFSVHRDAGRSPHCSRLFSVMLCRAFQQTEALAATGDSDNPIEDRFEPLRKDGLYECARTRGIDNGRNCQIT